MSAWELLFWWTMAGIGVIGCGLYAGLETGIYSLNRVRLHMFAQMGRPHAKQLSTLVHQPRSLLAALLLCTNLFTNLATSATGMLLHARHLAEWQVILADVLIVTPVLFIFSEVLPKDFFAAHADRLVYPLTPVLHWTRRLCTASGLLPAITLVSGGLMRLLGMPPHAPVLQPRRQVGAMVREAIGPGLVSDEQTAIVERVLELGGRTVSQEMIPWAKVDTLRLDATPAALWALAERTTHHRLPVVDHAGKVVGVLHLLDVLLHAMASCPPVSSLMREALTMPHSMPLRQALNLLQKSHVGQAVVLDRDKPVGLITIKDLIEPITGELASW